MAGESYINVWDTESRYVGDSRDSLLGTLTSIFWSYLAMAGVRSPVGALHLIRCVEACTNFFAPNSREPLVFAMPVMVFARDLYLRRGRIMRAQP